MTGNQEPNTRVVRGVTKSYTGRDLELSSRVLGGRMRDNIWKWQRGTGRALPPLMTHYSYFDRDNITIYFRE